MPGHVLLLLLLLQGGAARLREYLPALIMRQRAAMAAATGKGGSMPGRVQGPDAPPVGSLGRVTSVAGDRVSLLALQSFPAVFACSYLGAWPGIECGCSRFAQ
jgi:hypothetical protein